MGIRAKIFAAALLGGLSATGAVGLESPAGAICDFSYQTHNISSSGRGKEDYRYSSTCDGDGFYAGRVAEIWNSNNDGVPATIRVSTSHNGPWVYVGSASNLNWRNYNVQGVQYDNLQICDGYTGSCSYPFDLILF